MNHAGVRFPVVGQSRNGLVQGPAATPLPRVVVNGQFAPIRMAAVAAEYVPGGL